MGIATSRNLRTVLLRSAAAALLLVGFAAGPSLLTETPPAAFPFAAEVTGESVRLRSGPSEKYQTIKVMNKATRLTVTGEKNGWLSVKLPQDVNLYVAEAFVTDLGGGKALVKGKNVNLRISADTRYLPVGQVSDKNVALVTGADGKAVKEGGFFKIGAPDEALGWVFAGLLKEVPGAVVESAKPTAAGTTAGAVSGAAAPVAGAVAGAATTGAADATGPKAADLEKARPPKQDNAATDKAAVLADEKRAFKELDRLFIEEWAKPADKRNLTEIKNLYTQYSTAAQSEEIRKSAASRVEQIEKAEKKVQESAADAEKRIREARERAEKADAERAAKIAAETKAVKEKPVEVVKWVATGFVADHGRDARMPASHALTDADGNVLYFVRWDSGDLNTLFSKNVQIAGTTSDCEGWEKPVLVITRIQLADSQG